MTIHRSDRDRLYLVACASMFVFGIVLALPGAVLGLGEVVQQFGLTLEARGLLIATFFLGNLVGGLVSGPVVDTFGQRVSLTTSTLLVGLCLLLVASASSAAFATVTIGVLGVAAAGINTASNALTSDGFPDERGRRMNGLALSVGLGGLTLPVALAVGAGRISWRVAVWSAAALAATVALAGARTPALPPGARARVSAITTLREFLPQRGAVWFCVLMALAAASEASMAGWTSTYLSAHGYSSSAATWGLSSHWLGLIVGRLALGRHLDTRKLFAIVRGTSIGAVCLLVFATAPAAAVLAMAPFAIGVAISIIMPTSLALAGERLRGNAGTLFGVLLTFAQVGGMVLPSLIGVVASAYGLSAGMALLAVNAGAVGVVAWRAGRVPG